MARKYKISSEKLDAKIEEQKEAMKKSWLL